MVVIPQQADPPVELPVIRREEDPTLRQVPSSTSTSSRLNMLLGPAVVALMDELVATVHYPSVTPELVQTNPKPALLAPEPIQNPGLVQRPDPVQHPEPVEVSSSESGDASVNQSHEAVGSEPGFIGPHSAAAESVARTRIRPGPLLLARFSWPFPRPRPSSLRVPLLAPARPVVMRCADLSFADLSHRDLDSLAQVAIDLLVQTHAKSVATPILDRMIERITELQADLPLIRPPTSDTARSQPTPDTAAIEASLSKVIEDFNEISTRLSEL
ncbi:uncharacterized protein LOC127258484 [Andrographis paniculata]|uniref:uncharacterized protein LOC127258484 n=1 Tax=Andrographis paniculata TaxID=175694 RepID=UPI0021E92A5C|nr:uncharacterized protein LOC127258484 [Andrographis paniculata]